MSFPVPIAYNITDEHNTEVVYGNGDTLDLIRSMIDIPADLVLKYEEFTPDHDITNREQMSFKLMPYTSTIILFSLDDIDPVDGLDVGYLVWMVLRNNNGVFTQVRVTRVISSDGSIQVKSFITVTLDTQMLYVPTSANVILQANKRYAIIQLKLGDVAGA